jgi:sec-independent protein translocase protein TatA
MPFVGTGHMWLLGILLIIVLIIWGPGKLPDVGAGMGRAIREFRKASSETKEQFAVTTRADGASPVAVAPDAAAQAVPVTSSPTPAA